MKTCGLPGCGEPVSRANQAYCKPSHKLAGWKLRQKAQETVLAQPVALGDGQTVSTHQNTGADAAVGPENTDGGPVIAQLNDRWRVIFSDSTAGPQYRHWILQRSTKAGAGVRLDGVVVLPDKIGIAARH